MSVAPVVRADVPERPLSADGDLDRTTRALVRADSDGASREPDTGAGGTSSIDAYPVSSPFSSMNGWSAAAGQATVTYHMPSSMGMATAS